MALSLCQDKKINASHLAKKAIRDALNHLKKLL